MSIQVSFSNYEFFPFILEMSDFFCCAFVFFFSFLLPDIHLIVSNNHYSLAVD